MQDKLKRHAKIEELIKLSPIKTQFDLKKKLEESGILVNQATLSRDIKEMGLYKTSIEGVQRYAKQEATTTTKPVKGLSQFVKSIDHSRNIIVIKTDSGAANHVAEALDLIDQSEIIGTVAGDNTIFCVVNESLEISTVLAKLRSLFAV